jgi:3D (Asp-Asp-Asp) domain-containing protein
VATRTRDNPGTVAVAPDVIPYHTLLYVPGYGYCLAEDTGGFRFNSPNQLDLFMDTEEECIKWGRKIDHTVYIVEYNYTRK